VTTTGHPSGDRTGHGDPISVTTAPSALGGVTAHTERLAIPAYEVFMLLLSGLSIFNVIVVVGVSLVGWNGPGQEVVLAMDVAMTPIFVVDFVYRFRSAPSRNAYLVHGYGWADLAAIAPMLRILRVPRTAMVVAAIRSRGRDRVLAQLGASRAVATFLLTVFLVIAVVEFAGATIYYAESGTDGSNIASAGDAIWWALVTITTVGYGDRYPVTLQGRVIGAFLLFAGICLFSVLTGFIANAFITPRTRPRRVRALGDVPGTLAGVRQLLAEQDEHTDEIRQRINEVERLLDRSDDGRRGSA
jgi:voltage-gated potassium channel